MDREIGIGIVGCGSIARWKYAENLAVLPGASLRAFFGGRAEELRKAWGAPGAVTCGSLKELLGRSDVDAVCICTPNDSHAAITLAALRAGKHVLCEKPMAVDAASAEEMVRTAEESGVFLTVGHQARFYPSAQALHGELRAGRFGALYFARASMVRRMGIPTWGRFFDPVVQGGGCLMDLGTHALDLAMWLLDDFEPAYCSAGSFRGPGDMPTAANRWGPWDPEALKVETSAFGQVVMKSGAVLSIDTSWALHVPEDREDAITLCGTAAGAEWGPPGHHQLPAAGGGADRQPGPAGGLPRRCPAGEGASGDGTAVPGRRPRSGRAVPLRTGAAARGILRRFDDYARGEDRTCQTADRRGPGRGGEAGDPGHLCGGLRRVPGHPVPGEVHPGAGDGRGHCVRRQRGGVLQRSALPAGGARPGDPELSERHHGGDRGRRPAGPGAGRPHSRLYHGPRLCHGADRGLPHLLL